MNAADFLEQIESDLQTELSRLGSSKSLYADTEGEMDPDPVLRAAAENASHAASTVEEWAGESDLEPFENAVNREQDHLDALVDEIGEYEQGDGPAVTATLAEMAGTPARLGALVGWSLVTDRKATQSSGFFTGQAKPTTASLFRSFGDDYEATRAEALDGLDEVCDSEEDWKAAETAATRVISAAYDEYFETLEALGMNPKPVC